MTSTNATPTTSIPQDQASRLQRMNLVAAVLHLAQAAAMIVLSSDISLPVTAAYSTGPPGQNASTPVIETLFDYRLGWAVAAFSLLSSLFHFMVASPQLSPRYLADLSIEQNRFRWVEYSLSSSLMIVLIAGLTGITDAPALLGLFGVNASMILFGWLMETTNPPGKKPSWTPFVFGCIAGTFPWVAIAVYLFGAGSDVPGFVYGIFVSLFVFFNTFAINQWRQYSKPDSYLQGERIYIWLSLIAKSLLAWQIFANVLI